MKLSGAQRRKLRGLAHSLKPIVQIGHRGLTPELLAEISNSLDYHELIKVKFSDFKESKADFCSQIEQELQAENVGIIGHIAIFFRQQQDPEKRKIQL